MKLYTFWRSSAAYRVRIALNLKGLEYQSCATRLPANEQQGAEYLALNPQALVPTLIDGPTVVGQSLAIIEYLDETHPVPPLLPVEPGARAAVRAMALAIACDIHPLNNLRELNYLKGPLAQPEAAVLGWYRYWIATGLAALEQLAGRYGGDGGHLHGRAVTLADVCLVPQLYNARRYDCDLAPFPQLVRIAAALERLPAFAAASPERQPDAVRS